jgi:hypothetical protein
MIRDLPFSSNVGSLDRKSQYGATKRVERREETAGDGEKVGTRMAAIVLSFLLSPPLLAVWPKVNRPVEDRGLEPPTS